MECARGLCPHHFMQTGTGDSSGAGSAEAAPDEAMISAPPFSALHGASSMPLAAERNFFHR